MRRWKLSPMDLQSRARWVEYSRAKDEMFRYTDIKHAPWYVVQADDKRRARLNCIAHLLSMIDYEDLTPPPLELPPREEAAYVRPPMEEQTFVPEVSMTRGNPWFPRGPPPSGIAERASRFGESADSPPPPTVNPSMYRTRCRKASRRAPLLRVVPHRLELKSATPAPR